MQVAIACWRTIHDRYFSTKQGKLDMVGSIWCWAPRGLRKNWGCALSILVTALSTGVEAVRRLFRFIRPQKTLAVWSVKNGDKTMAPDAKVRKQWECHPYGGSYCLPWFAGLHKPDTGTNPACFKTDNQIVYTSCTFRLHFWKESWTARKLHSPIALFAVSRWVMEENRRK